MIPHREQRGLVSPFNRLLLSDVYDGPKAGVAVGVDGQLYAFQLLDWDDAHRVRVFSVALVPDLTWDAVQPVFRSTEPEDWSEWVLPVSLPPQAESVLQQVEATAQRIAVVASSDLLRSIEVWRPLGGDADRPPNRGWLEWLGLPRR